MAEQVLPKHLIGVRFPLPALFYLIYIQNFSLSFVFIEKVHRFSFKFSQSGYADHNK